MLNLSERGKLSLDSERVGVSSAPATTSMRPNAPDRSPMHPRHTSFVRVTLVGDVKAVLASRGLMIQGTAKRLQIIEAILRMSLF
jgi:hypothetical protein